MTFPGVSQPESNNYFPPLAKIRIAFDYVFFDLFSIIATWYARTTRHVILYNLREKSADDLNFWWTYCNFGPRPVTSYFPSYLSLGRVRAVHQDSWFAVHARIACMIDGQSARFAWNIACDPRIRTYSCYNPKRRKLPPSITSPIFDFFLKNSSTNLPRILRRIQIRSQNKQGVNT
jgi:hypothetical protein